MGLELDGVNGIIKNTTSDGDITIKGNDGGSEISLLTFDVSAEGVATFNKDVKLGDNSKALFGAAGDLEIFHDASNSYISDTGTGNLILKGAADVVLTGSNGENMVVASQNGGVTLYHNNIAKIATTSTGIDITGAFTATAASTITTADNTDTLTLISTDADAASGPNLRLRRDSSSPADDDDLGHIFFSGEDAAGNETNYITFDVITKTVADGSENGLLQIKTMSAGTLLELAAFQADGIIFNERSNDLDFRVESNSYAHCLFVDGGNDRVGIGENTDTGGLFRVSLGDSGQNSPAANAEEIVLEDNDNCGMSIFSGTGNTGTICFGDSGDANIGQIQYHHAEDSFKIVTNTAERFRITDGGKVGIFETAPDCSDGGLCINQGTGDSNILSLKSSDIAHARTSVAETDTYAEFHKAGINDGGLQITTLNDAGNIAFYLDAHARTNDTGKGTGDHGIMNFDANKHDGANGGESLLSNANMVTFSNDNSVRFIFDAEGDIHVDGSSSISTYDAYEDAQLVRAYDLSHGKGVIASQFDKFVQYNKDDLTDAGLVGRVNHETLKDGTEAKPLINMTGFVRLHNGAIWQQYEKHQRLAEAVYEMAKEALGKDKADTILNKHDIKLLN